MILAIDTSARELISLGLYDKKLRCFEFPTTNQSADILRAIDGLVKKNNIKLGDITGIVVNRGPGSFTGVRVGINVANTLAWSLKIPVVGYKKGEEAGALKKISKLKEFTQIALPYYDK